MKKHNYLTKIALEGGSKCDNHESEPIPPLESISSCNTLLLQNLQPYECCLRSEKQQTINQNRNKEKILARSRHGPHTEFQFPVFPQMW